MWRTSSALITADTFYSGESGNAFEGGSGADTVSYEGSDEGVVADLEFGLGSGGNAEGDTYDSVENLTGSDHDDVLIGDGTDNVLIGGGGDDVLSGGEGGADDLQGGDGSDTVSYETSEDGIGVNLSASAYSYDRDSTTHTLTASETSGGEAAGDTLSGIENIAGTANDDVLGGDSGDNVLSGGAGDDVLIGGAGDDTIEGGFGDADIAVFSGVAADYTVELVNGTITVTDTNTSDGDDGTDTVTNVDELQFSDKSYAVADIPVGLDAVMAIDAATTSVTFTPGHSDATNWTGSISISMGAAANGTLTDNGDGTYTFDPDTNFTGVEEIAFTVDAGSGVTSEATISIDVRDRNFRETQSLIFGPAEATFLAGGSGFAGSQQVWTFSAWALIEDALAGPKVVYAESLDGDWDSIYFDAAGHLIASLGNSADAHLITTEAYDASDGWLHLVVSVDTNAANAADRIKIFIDGSQASLQLASTEPHQGHQTTINAGGDRFVGRGQLGGVYEYFSGELAQVQLVDGVALAPADFGVNDGQSIWRVKDRVFEFEEIVVNGTFDTDTSDWTTINSATVTVVDEEAQITRGANDDAGIQQEIDDELVEGHRYLVSGTVRRGTAAGDVEFSIWDDTAGSALGSHQTSAIENEFFSFEFVANASASIFARAKFLSGSASGETMFIDNISIVNMAYGANGFRLEFADEFAPGTDSSGVGNEFAAVNLPALNPDFEDSNLGAGPLGYDSVEFAQVLVGAPGDDVLDGGAGDDLLIGGDGADTLTGKADDDVLIGGAGADTLAGDAGTDTVSYEGGEDGVTVTLNASGDATGSGGDADGDSLTGIENLIGSAGDDTLTGNASDNILAGDAGDDTLTGGGGADTFDGGIGFDTVDLSGEGSAVTVDLSEGTITNGTAAQDDTVTGVERIIGTSSADTLTGDSFDNEFVGGGGGDTIAGGLGIDTASYAGSSSAVTVTLEDGGADAGAGIGAISGGDAAGDVLTDVENLTGSDQADTLTGDAGNNVIEGGAGGDTLAGGDGLDTVAYTDSSAGVVVDLETNSHSGGDAAGDSLSGFENVVGSDHNDQITGDLEDNQISAGTGDDTVYGNLGHDIVTGGDGADTLWGDDNSGGTDGGDDTLFGGAGDDTLRGESGDDVLDGGEGQDTAVFSGNEADYSWTVENGVVTIKHLNGGKDGTDTLTGIESLQFADNTVDISESLDIFTGDDAAETDVETLVTIDVLANDIDSDGETLTINAVADPDNGTAAIVDGKIDYTPDAGFFGSDSFAYEVSDGNGGTATGTITVIVNPSAPTAGDDDVTVYFDQATTIAVLANDTDPNGNPITINSVTTAASNGTTVVNQDGTITYTPNTSYVGSDSFVYEIEDSDSNTATATVSLTVSSNSAPVATDDAALTVEGAPISISVLSNDTDADVGDTLTIDNTHGPLHGTVAINQDNTITYTPTAGYTGLDSFTYTITDDEGAPSIATVDVSVTAYELSRSLRLNAGQASYLERTPSAAADDLKTWTFSTWINVGQLGGDQYLLSSDGDANNYEKIWIEADGSLRWSSYKDSAYRGDYRTSAPVVDPGEWQHVIVSKDAANSRIYVWVDGVEQALDVVGGYTIQDYDGAIGSAYAHQIGAFDGANTFDGLMAGVTLVQGEFLTPSAFTTLNQNGDRIPLNPIALPFGADRFSLDFADVADLGADVSGNDLDFIEVNLSTANQSADTPSKTQTLQTPVDDAASWHFSALGGTGALTFALDGADGGAVNGSVTLDDAATGTFTYTPDSAFAGEDSFSYTVTDTTGKVSRGTVHVSVGLKPEYAEWTSATGITLSESNARVTVDTAKHHSRTGLAIADGAIIYAEFEVMQTSSYGPEVGIATSDFDLTHSPGDSSGTSDQAWVYRADGYFINNGSSDGTPTSFGVGDEVGMAVQRTGNTVKVWWSRNGVWEDASGAPSPDPATGTDPAYTITLTSGQELYVIAGARFGGASVRAAFDAAIQTYTAPSGFGELWQDRIVAPTSSDDYIAGNSFANVLDGGAGDDLLSGRGGDDVLDGGTGSDIAEFTGDIADYEITRDGDELRVKDTVGSGGTDVLRNIETLRFADGDVLPASLPNALETTVRVEQSRSIDGVIEGTDDVTAQASLTYTLATDGANGSVTVNSDGTFTYEADDGYVGSDAFVVRIADGDGYGALATVDVDVVAPPVSAGSDGQVNTYTTNNQLKPSIAVLSDGGHIVTWNSYGQDGSSNGVFGQRYDSDGIAVGGEFQVNTTTSNHQRESSAVGLTGGGFVVVWQDEGGADGSGYGIFGQRYDVDGVAAGSEFQVNIYTSSHQYEPSIASLTNGGFVVTWASNAQDGSSYGVYGQRFNADGTTAGSEFLVNTTTSNHQREQAVVGLLGGGFVVVWQDEGGADGSSLGVFGQRYDSADVKVGGEFQINTYTSSWQYRPSVAALENGGFVVFWSSYNQDGSSYSVFGQRYNSDGTTAGSEFQANTTTSGTQTEPEVVGLVGGGFVVIWQDESSNDGSSWGVYGQQYDHTGSKAGTEFIVNEVTTNAQYEPSVAALADGGFVVAYRSDSGRDGNYAGVFQRVFSGVSQTLVGGVGNDSLMGGAADDTLDGGAGQDTLVGGAGTDTATYANATGAVTIDLAAGSGTGAEAEGDTYSEIENVTGSAYGDTLTGGTGMNLLDGGAGDDLLDGGADEDVLIGGAGTDTAVYAGSVGDFEVRPDQAPGSYMVTDLNAADGDAGMDLLIDVETIRIGGTDYDLSTFPVADDSTFQTPVDDAASWHFSALGGTGALTFALDGADGGAVNGSVTLDDAAEGTFTYTPDTGYAGDDSISFTVTDQDGRVSRGTVNVSVGAGTSYQLLDSGVFEDGDSSYLSWTPASAGDTKTWTYSAWVKRSELGTAAALLSAHSGSSYDLLRFESDDTLAVYQGGTKHLQTTATFTNTSDWMHVVLSYDADNATAADRIQLFVDGTRVTDFSTEVSLGSGTASHINDAVANQVGRHSYGADSYFDGYASQVAFVDGQALGASSFGASDASGTWVPTDVSGLTYGTNGYLLDFADDTNLGNDVSGNTNDLTVNGLTADSQSQDTPTNNFATLDAANKHSSVVLNDGNLSGNASSYYQVVRGTEGVSSGKWYWEWKANPYGTYARTGIMADGLSVSASLEEDGAYWAYLNNGTKFWLGSQGFQTGVGSNTYDNQVHDVALAVDLDAGKVYVRYDGVWQNGADPDAGTGGFDIDAADMGKTFYPFFAGNDASYNQPFSANFGAGAAGPLFDPANLTYDADAGGSFRYAPPEDFLAMGRQNLSPLYFGTATSSDDYIVGNAQDNAILGGAGHDYLEGGDGDDTLDGGAGPDVLRGGSGDDSLIGGGGYDTYEIGSSDGIDTIQEMDGASTVDQVIFDTGVDHDDLWFQQDGDDLLVRVMGSADNKVRVQDWYTSDDAQIDTFIAGDGNVLLNSALDQLVAAMAGFDGGGTDPAVSYHNNLPQDVQTTITQVWNPSS